MTKLLREASAGLWGKNWGLAFAHCKQSIKDMRMFIQKYLQSLLCEVTAAAAETEESQKLFNVIDIPMSSEENIP